MIPYKRTSVGLGLSFLLTLTPMAALAQNNQTAFVIAGKSTTLDQVYKENQATFYEIEKKKYEEIERIAREKYLEYFWEQRAKKAGQSVAQAREEYEKKNLKVNEKEVKETLDRFKDHPSLKNLPKQEQERQIRDFLADRGRQELYEGIIEAGIKKGELVISYPAPEEPVYDVKVTKDDYVRYGPEYTDTTPQGCEGDACPITVVEYSEFQCPFCVRVLPDVKRVMTEYRGKVRWIVRDFPLSFHDRARPAAIAAHCAGEQGKFWQMYGTLFENQRKLGDEDLARYADQVGLDKKKWEKCVADGKVVEKINRNFQSGVELGVSGTPAFFINGRRLSGAMPFSEFQKIIEQELKGGKKT